MLSGSVNVWGFFLPLAPDFPQEGGIKELWGDYCQVVSVSVWVCLYHWRQTWPDLLPKGWMEGRREEGRSVCGNELEHLELSGLCPDDKVLACKS